MKKIVITLIAGIILSSGLAIAKSDKKSTADSKAVKFADPQVLEEGDQLIGARTGLGNIMNGGPGLGLYYSFQNTKNLSYDGQFFYSSYNLMGVTATSMLFLGYASFHADLLKVPNLDTYASAGLYYNMVNVSGGGASVGGNTLGFTASITARYFFDSTWSLSGTIGNVGTIIVGLDYTL